MLFSVFKGSKSKKVDDVSKTIAYSETILNNAESFTIPDTEKIDKYIKAFDVVLKNSKLNDLFKIVKFIEQESANGLIYVVELKRSKSKFSKLLIKIQRSQLADPASYEYYVGLALNKLRGMSVPNFGLVYGRFNCGFNPIGDSLCDNSYEEKTFVLYEYITSMSDKTITLHDYIHSDDIEKDIDRKNINLVNIMVMLLISIQKAQDAMEFTHYDLHLGNILLVELNSTYNFVYEYNNKKYNIVLDYFPFIIDYGRSHVNPKIVDDISPEIYDMDKKKYYKGFEEYQNKMWNTGGFSMTDTKPLVRHIKKKLINSNFVTKLKKVMRKEFAIVENPTVDMILDNFYDSDKGEISYNITPWKFNPYFDHCKLLNHVCENMMEKLVEKNVYSEYSRIWMDLEDKLEATFPFYIPGFYGVSKYYQFETDDLKRPIDVVEYLYIDIESTNIVKEGKMYEKLYFNQLGGEASKEIYSKIHKKMKEKW